MPISINNQVDYLFKKIGYGVATTANASVKSPSNESIASPLTINGAQIWQQATDIPASQPSISTGVVQVYNDANRNTVETVMDMTSPAYQTWKTGIVNWIDTSFNSTYQVKVYWDVIGSTSPQTTGTQLFADGTGNDDEWYFDYDAGILTFPDNIPALLQNSTGYTIYIVGSVYIGQLGLNYFAGPTSFADVSTIASAGSINITPAPTAVVNINSDTALLIPTGNTISRPLGVNGYIRYNTDLGIVEVFSNGQWAGVNGSNNNIIYDQYFTADGVSNVYPLTSNVTASGILVSINGVVQQPNVAYTVSGNIITFTQTPVSTDTVDIRYLENGTVPVLNTPTVSFQTVVVTTPYTQITTIPTVLDMFSVNEYRSAKYTISGDDGVNAHMAEVQISQINGNIAFNAYSLLNTTSDSITYSANISSGTVYFSAQGLSSTTTVRIQRTYFTV